MKGRDASSHVSPTWHLLAIPARKTTVTTFKKRFDSPRGRRIIREHTEEQVGWQVVSILRLAMERK
jgi:hypothetical protein